MKHIWTYNDDVIAFYLCRYERDNKELITRVAEKMGFKNNASLRLRIGNFQFLDGKGRLKNAAKLSIKVYDDYKGIDKAIHSEKFTDIMGDF